MVSLTMLLTLWMGGLGPRVKVEPVLWQDDDQPATYLKYIHQLESNGVDLFISDSKETKIIQIEADGAFVRQIGQKGPGPEEFGKFGPFSIAARGEQLWAIDAYQKRAMYFEKGEFTAEFRLNSYQVNNRMGQFPFAFDSDRIVVPVHPGKGKLSAAYDYGGNVQQSIGVIFPINQKVLFFNPAHNATMWVRDEQRRYCLFKYRPILRVFDSKFEKIKEFQLTGPEIDSYDEAYIALEKDPQSG